MENDIIYFSDFPNLQETGTRKDNGKFDLTLLPTQELKEEFRGYIMYRCKNGTFRALIQDRTAYNHIAKFLNSRINRRIKSLGDRNPEKWISLLKGDSADYGAFITKVKSNGATYVEKDKQALSEANAPKPNLVLLKARLLFDGGYLSRSLELLSGYKMDDFKSAKDKTEYAYRMARLHDDLGKDATALSYYQNAINLGKGMKYYYAAKAAILSGAIYEKRKDFRKAKVYYNLAIDMKDHEYENGIENDAKQSLKRIGG